MRLSFATLIVLAAALSTSAVPLYDIEEEYSLASRGNEGHSWSTVSDDKKFHQQGGHGDSNKLQPHPGVKDTHITYRKGPVTGWTGEHPVTNYEVWKHNPKNPKNDGMTHDARWRGFGKSHGGVNPPLYYDSKGKASAAQSHQNPHGYDAVKAAHDKHNRVQGHVRTAADKFLGKIGKTPARHQGKGGKGGKRA